MTDLTESFRASDLPTQARAVRALARRVASDANEADELAQQAMLHQLSRADGGASPGPGWFVGLMRNLASKRRRGEARRSRRERLAVRPTPVLEPSELVQHAETLQHVVRAALELDEPYRTTILLRYLQEYSVAEVASTMDVPESTVRVRTKRGIERLRERLQRTMGAGFALVLLEFADSPTGAGIGSAGSDPSSTFDLPEAGGDLSSMIWKATAAVCAAGVLATVGTAVLSGGDPIPATFDRDVVLATVDVAGDVERTSVVVPGSAGSDQDPATAGASTPLTGAVVDPSGTPIVGATVRVFDRPFEGSARYRNGDFIDIPRVATTGSDGRFSVVGRSPFETCGIVVDAAGYAQALVGYLPYKRDEKIVLYPTANVSGVVRDATSGHAIEGATIRIRELSITDSRATLYRGATTDADGAYVLTGVRAESKLTLEIAQPGAACAYTEVNLAAGESATLDIGLLSDSFVEVSVVDDATDEPVVGATVYSAGRERTALGQVGAEGAFLVTVPRIEGAAAWDGWSASPLALVHADGYCATAGRLGVPNAAGTSSLQIRLVPASRVTGVVRDGTGAPIAGAHVAWFAPPLRFVEPRGSGLNGPDSAWTITGADGSFAFEHVLAKARTVEGELRAYSGLQVARIDNALPTEVGGERHVELVIGHGFSLSGQAFVNGTPSPAFINIESSDGSVRASTHSLADGSFSFAGLPTGRYELAARSRGANIPSATLEVDLEGNLSGVEIDVVASVTEIRGVVLYDDGSPAAGRDVLTTRTGESDPPGEGQESADDIELGVTSAEGGGGMAMLTSVAQTGADGSFVIELTPNPRATYRLAVYQGGFGVVATGVREGAVDVELRVPRMRSVRLDVRRQESGDPVQRLGIKWVHPASGREVTIAWRQSWSTQNGVIKIDLPVGDLRLTLRDQDTGAVSTTQLDANGSSYSIEV